MLINVNGSMLYQYSMYTVDNYVTIKPLKSTVFNY